MDPVQPELERGPVCDGALVLGLPCGPLAGARADLHLQREPGAVGPEQRRWNDAAGRVEQCREVGLELGLGGARRSRGPLSQPE